jgi:hypothetical protein
MLALTNIARDASGISYDELTEYVARLYGWNRRGPDISSRLAALVSRLRADGVLVSRGGGGGGGEAGDEEAWFTYAGETRIVSPDASSEYEVRAAQRVTGEAQVRVPVSPAASAQRPPADPAGSNARRQAPLERQAKASDADRGQLTGSPIGPTYRHIDMALTLLEARSSFTVPMKQYRSQQNKDLRAEDGAKLVTIRTEVLNDARESIDLTCSRPIQTYLFDDRGRRFDSVGKLYQIAGNPECNEQLQPGFTSQMTWVYRVPLHASIVAFEFEDVSDFTRDRTVTPTRIPLVIADP